MTARNVVELPLNLIDDSDRLRPVDDAYAALLAESIEQRGLDTPILVGEPDTGGRHRLLAGAHRLAAFRLLARKTIPALVTAADEIEARLIEVDENLMRRELNPLDRGRFLTERKRLHEALTGRRRGGDRKGAEFREINQTAKMAVWSARFTDEVAERTGLSEREIRRSIARYGRLAEDLRERVAGTWIATSATALDALVKLSPAQQRDAVAFLLDRGGTDMGAAIRHATGAQAKAAPDAFDRFVEMWRHMDRRERERVRRFVTSKESET